jgi:opacity protein-like surface antigen
MTFPLRASAFTAFCAIVLVGLSASDDARADPSAYRFELTPILGYRFGGQFDQTEGETTIDLDDASNFGLILNGRDERNTQWEVYYSQQATSADTATVPGLASQTDVDIHYLQIGGTYRGSGERFKPFLSAGIGGTHISPDAAGLDSETYVAFSVGTGLQFFTTERWGMRIEGRAIGTLLDTDSELFCVSEGGAVCAFRLEGRVLWQFETFAGVTFRF